MIPFITISTHLPCDALLVCYGAAFSYEQSISREEAFFKIVAIIYYFIFAIDKKFMDLVFNVVTLVKALKMQELPNLFSF